MHRATWAALRGLWDFHSDHPAPPSEAAVRERLPFVDYRAVEMDARAQTIRLAHAGVAVGLGGIAKGYALDRARQILLDADVHAFVLYAGGQVLAEGTHHGRPWRVGIQHPRSRSQLLGALSITSGSVTTGGDYEHYFMSDGRRYHHILDPSTGFRREHTLAVTVFARTGATSRSKRARASLRSQLIRNIAANARTQAARMLTIIGPIVAARRTSDVSPVNSALASTRPWPSSPAKHGSPSPTPSRSMHDAPRAHCVRTADH